MWYLLVLSLDKSYPPPSKWVGLGSPLAAWLVCGDLSCSVHTVNNLCMFNCQWHVYLCNRGPYVRLAFMPNTLSSWNKVVIIIIKILTMWLYHRVMSPKQADGMANSVHRGQTRSSLIWVYTVCLGLSVQKLRINTVINNFLSVSPGVIAVILWTKIEASANIL